MRLPRDLAGTELAALLRRYGYEMTWEISVPLLERVSRLCSALFAGDRIYSLSPRVRHAADGAALVLVLMPISEVAGPTLVTGRLAPWARRQTQVQILLLVGLFEWFCHCELPKPCSEVPPRMSRAWGRRCATRSSSPAL